MKCFKTYIRHHVNCLWKGEDKHCPELECDGEVVHLDELIAPIIIELNKKGYYTKYCCAGHWYNNEKVCSPYIYFEEGYAPKTCPEYFYFERNGTVIRRRFREQYEFTDSYFFVLDTNKRLYEWVKDLPDNNI